MIHFFGDPCTPPHTNADHADHLNKCGHCWAAYDEAGVDGCEKCTLGLSDVNHAIIVTPDGIHRHRVKDVNAKMA